MTRKRAGQQPRPCPRHTGRTCRTSLSPARTAPRHTRCRRKRSGPPDTAQPRTIRRRRRPSQHTCHPGRSSAHRTDSQCRRWRGRRQYPPFQRHTPRSPRSRRLGPGTTPSRSSSPMLRRGRSHTRAIKSCQRPSAHSGWAAQWRKCGRKTHSAIGGAQSPRCAAPLCEQGAAEAAGLRSAATRNADSTAAPVRPLSSGLPCPGNLPFRATRAATTDAARVRPNVLGAATCWRWDARRPGPSMRLRGEDRPAACRLFLPSQTTNTTATFGRPSRRAPAPQSMVWEHPVSWVWGCAAPLGTAWSAHSESNPGEKYPVCHLPQFWARPVCRAVSTSGLGPWVGGLLANRLRPLKLVSESLETCVFSWICRSIEI